MTYLDNAAAVSCAATLALAFLPADAHVVAGARVFPVALTFDDPGVGDLPIPMLRPFAVTGELTYTIADTKLKQSQIRNMIEFTWSSPALSPSTQGTAWIAAPGAIHMAGRGEVGVEAPIPLNKAAGTNVGVVGLVHFFLDDLFPNNIGRPVFQ